MISACCSKGLRFNLPLYLEATILTFLLSFFFISCSKAPLTNQLNTAFDKLEISFLSSNQIVGHLRSVVYLEQHDQQSNTLVQSCTGIFISRNHLLTASHCADGSITINPWNTPPPDRVGSYSIFQMQGVIFGEYQGTLDERFKRVSKKGIFLGSPIYKIDHAGFAVFYISDEQMNEIFENELRSRFDWINLSRLKPFRQTGLVLWHYPWGMPLAESPCSQVELSPPNLYAHNCDGVAGSSGGLLTDPLSGSPAAMHLSGPGLNLYSYYNNKNQHESTEDFALRRGCKQSEDLPLDPICHKERGFNKAVPLTYIKDVMAQENRWLWDKIAEASRKDGLDP